MTHEPHIVRVFADDMAVTRNERLKKHLRSKFEIKDLGELKSCLTLVPKNVFVFPQNESLKNQISSQQFHYSAEMFPWKFVQREQKNAEQ